MQDFENPPSLKKALASGKGNDYWRWFAWEELPADALMYWQTLGCNQHNWNTDFFATHYKLWSQLSYYELQAAEALGFDAVLWEAPSIAESILQEDRMAYWRSYKWGQMPAYLQILWQELGWDNYTWNELKPAPTSWGAAWGELSIPQQYAAQSLGFTEGNWPVF